MILKNKLLTGLAFLATMNPSYAEDRALLVGIDDYLNVSPLQGSKQDVENMRRFIQSAWGYQDNQIRVLIDGQATKEGILKALDEWLVGGTTPGDRALFYYSGHGYFLADDNGDEPDKLDETLCAVDATVKENQIRDDEIEARIKRLTGRQITVIVDACHSGTITRGLDKTPNSKIKVPVFMGQKPVAKPMTRAIGGLGEEQEGFTASKGDIVAYSAVAPNQEALVDTERGSPGGVFTSRFIEGIEAKKADANQDGKVSNAELLEYLRQESQAYCTRNPSQCSRGKLSPQLETKPELLAADISTGKAPQPVSPSPAPTPNPVPNTQASPPPSPPSPPPMVQATNILVHENSANLQVKMLPQTNFQLGDVMKVQVQSDREGYLLLFDLNSAGTLIRLFPNQYSEKQGKQGVVKPGKTLTIPDAYYGFDFTAEEPVGKGVVIALLVEDKLANLQNRLPAAFKAVEGPQAQTTLQELRTQLNQVLQQQSGANGTDRPIQWSVVFLEYEITPKKGLRG